MSGPIEQSPRIYMFNRMMEMALNGDLDLDLDTRTSSLAESVIELNRDLFEKGAFSTIFNFFNRKEVKLILGSVVGSVSLGVAAYVLHSQLRVNEINAPTVEDEEAREAAVDQALNDLQ